MISAPPPSVGFPRYDMAERASINGSVVQWQDTEKGSPLRRQYQSIAGTRFDSSQSRPFNACPVLPPLTDGIPPVAIEAGRAPFNDCGGVDSVCPTRASSPRATEAKGTTEAMRATARVSATSRCNSGPQSPFSPVCSSVTRPATTSVGAKGVLLKDVVSSAFMTGLPRFFKHAAMAKKFAPNK